MSQKNNSDVAEASRLAGLFPLVLLLFVLAGVVCAVGALFIKYRLEDARDLSAAAVRARLGVEFGFDALQAEGLRSLHVSGLHMAAPVPGVGRVTMDVDALRLRLSFWDLIQGRAAIGSAQVDGGRVVIDRGSLPEARRTAPGSGAGFDFSPAWLPPITLSGRNCQVEIRSASQADTMLIEDIEFRFDNRPDIPETTLSISAHADAAGNTAILSARAAWRHRDAFDASVEVKNLSRPHIAQAATLPDGFDGRLSARLHVWSREEHRVMARLEAELDQLRIPVPEAPIPLHDLDAVVHALVQWDRSSRRVDIHGGTLTTPLATAVIGGHLDLADGQPVLDITATLSDVPFDSLLSAVLPEALAAAGTLEAEIDEGAAITLTARGPLSAPALSLAAVVPEATVAFTPANSTLPRGAMRLKNATLRWDDFSGLPTGLATIADGAIIAEPLGLSATALMGTLVLDEAGPALRPVSAMISDRPWSGTAQYHLASGALDFQVSGALTDIEDTPLHDLVEKLWLSGEIAFRGSGRYGPDGRVQISASADVTRGGVAFEWWLNKPIGVGASIHNIDVLIEPGNKLEVQGEAAIEDTQLLARFHYVPHNGRWQTQHIRLDLPHLEINSAGKCIQIPYTAVGGACRDGFYEWTPAGQQIGDNISTFGGQFDYVSFLPDGGDHPLVCHDAAVTVTMTNIEGLERHGEIVVHAASAQVPPFGEDWLLPIGPTDQEYQDKYPEEPRPMTYKLSADTISVPPWEGREFAGEVYSNEEETGFHFFRAKAGDGRLEGVYRHEREENIMHLQATWDSIPAAYIIRHLELPEVLAGDITGEVAYVVDQDDPRTTMRAEGHFVVERAHFIVEQLGQMLMEEIGGSIIALHPDALAFDRVASDVHIVGDTIRTDNLIIQSEGITITGNGVWVMDGDLDYRVDVAVSPDLADQIPVLRDNFNVQGFRLTQRNIELGFHITGPTFRPTGQLAGLPPVGVTLVSGAAEMTGEAIRLFDMPRQMFMSVFRIGGGILGATRTQQQQQQQQQQ